MKPHPIQYALPSTTKGAQPQSASTTPLCCFVGDTTTNTSEEVCLKTHSAVVCRCASAIALASCGGTALTACKSSVGCSPMYFRTLLQRSSGLVLKGPTTRINFRHPLHTLSRARKNIASQRPRLAPEPPALLRTRSPNSILTSLQASRLRGKLSTNSMSTRRSARLSAAAEAKAPPAEMVPPPAPNPRKRKAARVPDPEPTDQEPEPAATPSTPKRRAKAGPAVTPPPATPTPGNAKLISEPAVTGVTPKPKPAAVRRLADPKGTNATLLSPETSRVVATREADAASPTKGGQARKTTASILDEANAHLIRVDPRMEPLVRKNYCRVFSPEGLAEKIDPFESLCSGIISQQVSGAAAKAIKKRFVDLFASASARFPQPSQVAATKIETLRTAGLSQRKAEYVQGLAEKFASGELSAQMLADASDEEILERLTAVRGLGRWSVEMFACFALKRMDVFSLGDLGIQRGSKQPPQCSSLPLVPPRFLTS